MTERTISKEEFSLRKCVQPGKFCIYYKAGECLLDRCKHVPGRRSDRDKFEMSYQREYVRRMLSGEE